MPQAANLPGLSRQTATRFYRLVDASGSPHPVLDDLYESLDAAWAEALLWWQQEFGLQKGCIDIGVEVSTASGSWRTLRHPGGSPAG
ncbi:hypothetical protein [Cyanobium sp. WAJ14-Wanaka]|uniref:hypothetical protein n=1 Tax=Cyanobium sp. WAJ14-Wanaka TaxID=2823725 RepID=UPI0020CC6812|nr:hypothetical protein [Cyanobium sp. WAJ14-Wanaka]MCP9774891.1 hypothetical protein [Cyanobium sp. WAJ14-Wanaka]